MPKFLIILFCAALLVTNVRAQTEFVTTHSLSKQFVVYGPKLAPAKRSARTSLDPAVLVVSCERIKQAVLAELGEPERWRSNSQNKEAGKIYIVLHPSWRQSPVITPIKSFRGLSFRIDLPNEIESADLIEAVTQATLLERVNRQSAENLTPIPRWLTQGMAAQVHSSAPDTLVLQQNQPISTTKVRVDPIAKIRQDLQKFEPLTFDELSWPGTLSREKNRRYDGCAQLFVHELLHLKNGDACLRQFLAELPQHLNWQVAFMRAFQPHFTRLVDVEKWWGLRLVNLTGRDSAHHWSREQSLERMDAVLRIPVQIHSASALPGRNEITLQEILSQWEPESQERALVKVVTQLQVLRGRVQPECARLLDEYRAVLETYLRAADKGIFRHIFSRNDGVEQKQTAQLKLNALDQQRAELRKKAKPATREEAVLSALEITAQNHGSSGK